MNFEEVENFLKVSIQPFKDFKDIIEDSKLKRAQWMMVFEPVKQILMWPTTIFNKWWLNDIF